MRAVPGLDALVRVLDHHHGRRQHRAYGNRNTAKRHDVSVHPLVVHDDKGDQNSQRQRNDRDEGRAQVKQEHHAHQRHDDELLDELLLKVRHRALDEAGTVIDADDLDARRQARLELFDFCLDRVDRLERVLARAHHDHTARDFAFAVQLGDAAPHLGADLQARDIAKSHGDSRLGRHERNLAKIVERLQIAGGAHHIFGFAQLQHRAAALLVAALHRVHDLHVRDAESAHPLRIEHDLVLAHHPAHARHFRDVWHRLQFVLEEPVLKRAQLRQIHLAAPVDQRVFVHPAHAGGIGPERGLGLRRQPRLHLVEVFEHARARPVGVGAVLEQDVHERIAEHRVAAHRFCARHR